MLNAIWVGVFLIAFSFGLFRMLVLGQTEIFPGMMKAAFDTSRTAFEIAIGLTGVMTLWLGVMRIGEQGGFLRLLTRLMTPMASRRCARCRS